MAEAYKYQMVKTTLEYPTEERKVSVKTGTAVDPETGITVDVFTDQLKTFKLTDQPLQLNLPYKVYSQTIVRMGRNITYSLDKEVEGVEVVALIAYMNEDHPSGAVKNERVKAEGFSGKIGTLWSDIRINADYKRHWAETKAEKLATRDELGVVTKLYAGADKTDPTKFAVWEGSEPVVDPVVEPVIKPVIKPI